MRDPAFRPHLLERFAEFLQNRRVVRYPNVGHFVPDEAGPEVAEEIAGFG